MSQLKGTYRSNWEHLCSWLASLEPLFHAVGGASLHSAWTRIDALLVYPATTLYNYLITFWQLQKSKDRK